MSTIIVPSDFSKNATVALKYAIRLSQVKKSNLIVFHCSHISAYALSAANTKEAMSILLAEDQRDKMEKLLQQVKKAYRYLKIKEIPSSTSCIVEFNPMVVEKTIELAKKNKADLIIMGTHGATGINKFFFGSTTTVMLSKSTVPVLAIPEHYKYSALKKIVLASDLKQLSTELDKVIPFARITGAKLNVLYLNYGIDPDNTKILNARHVISDKDHSPIKLAIQDATIDSKLVTHLKNYIKKTKPQCLVMFTRERSLWDRLLLKGSKTEDMASRLSIPLLSIKK